jgi:hypothetical protein
MNTYLLLTIGGILHLSVAVFHLLFWHLFKWKIDLKSLSPINKSVMPVMNICLIIYFLMNAFISFFYPDELINTNLGVSISTFITFFWLVRTVLQFIYFDYKKPVSILLIIIFISLTLIYASPIIN